MPATAHINRIAVAVPPNDIHLGFTELARRLLADGRAARLFERMAERAAIRHRYSVLRMGDVGAGEIDAGGFYRRAAYPSTGARMALYADEAPTLALRAIAGLQLDPAEVTHVIVASCTGFSAPGLDLQIADRLGLSPHVERSLLGFMGCSAAIPALRTARHIVRSDATARVLVVALELCTLHLQETVDLEQILTFLLFGDGAAACLVTAEESGIALDSFRAAIIPGSADLITWHIGDQGFDMQLSGRVPGRIAEALREELGRSDGKGLLPEEGSQAIDLWAVHAGGRTVLDAVESGLSLAPQALGHSRAVLQDYGNMSSATVLFVLERMLRDEAAPATGLAMAFGPGMVAESFRFHLAG